MVAGGSGSGSAPDGTRGAARQAPKARSYENSQRSRQAAATRERIVATATDLVHELPNWDWRNLTVRAVARRAGVNESTVYRHFATERNLRDAVLRQLETEAGVELENLTLDNFGQTIAQTFAYLATFPIGSRPIEDPTFAALDERRRHALRAALTASAADWTDEEREMTAAALDAFWSVGTFERMVTTWDLDPEKATSAATWVIGLIEAAVRDGRGPGQAAGA
ncbi:TetR/AcrR family transcriptional regulator [Pseudofrankia inefficax]|uniref:Regulatory protein TetR n=1 Tax=Pseudofrankia inefficax (strain DSM 45817 / CECT 9037 / DDB 130130 / EuI1c) TaxID=298654 RepID=E3J6M5_PSEI1|nr:TetR/AcrR family transcriptional regulator [Pseudofrankia inefficax]ADP81949.1 regulatory protein TetR [Pseudofrankia inefficax]